MYWILHPILKHWIIIPLNFTPILIPLHMPTPLLVFLEVLNRILTRRFVNISLAITVPSFVDDYMISTSWLLRIAGNHRMYTTKVPTQILLFLPIRHDFPHLQISDTMWFLQLVRLNINRKHGGIQYSSRIRE